MALLFLKKKLFPGQETKMHSKKPDHNRLGMP